MDPTRVLFVVGGMEIGGVQSGIMNFARITPPDQVRFDIVVLSETVGYHEVEFQKYGTVYHIPLMQAKNKYLNAACLPLNDIDCRRKMKHFLATHGPYDVVHAKLLKNTAPVMEAARMSRIPVRIAQSHVDKPDDLSLLYSLFYRWCAGRIEKNATVKLAVSEKAVDLLFAPYSARIIKNPTISLEKLDPSRYPPDYHTGIRLIQVGTYSRRKNQCFSVEILKELLDSGQEAQLSFVGFPLDEPEYIHAVEDRIRQLGVSDQVVFYPKDADVPLLLSRSDYMLIPSLREGLPNVALEAQAMGVPCFLSDTITKATDCGLCTFLSLLSGPGTWAQEIIDYRRRHGAGKGSADISFWDQRKVLQEYMEIWKSR